MILDEENYTDSSKEFGVNFRSVLTQPGALIPDVMHNLLDGVVQYESAKALHRRLSLLLTFFSIKKD